MRGRVRELYDVLPSSVNLGDVLTTPEESTEQRFVVRSGIFLANLEVNQDEPLFDIEVIANSPKPKEFTVCLGMQAAPELGIRHANLTILGHAQSGERLPLATVPVSFRGVADVGINPELPHFGGIPIGVTRKEEFKLFSRTNRPFRISAVRVFDIPSLEYTLLPDEDQVQHPLLVKLTGLESGHHSGHMEIDWQRESLDGVENDKIVHGTLHVPVSYFGVHRVEAELAAGADVGATGSKSENEPFSLSNRKQVDSNSKSSER